MPLPSSLKADLSVAAALAGIGLLTAASRQQPQRPPPPPRPTTDAGSLAALREELRQPPDRPRSSPSADPRGREAKTPTEIPARGWWDIAKRVGSQIFAHRLLTEAAGITFYSLLALFPALAALVSIYGLIADPASVSDQINSMSGVVPGGGMDIIGDQVKRVASTSNGALGFSAIAGLLVALWSANGGTKAMFDSLNVVYDEHEKRGYVRLTLTTLAVTIGALIFMVLAMACVVALPIALNFVGLGGITEILIRVLRWPLLLVAVAVLLAFIYRYGPSREDARWRWVTWGGGFAAILWVIVSLGFSWYVANFGSYNKTYGSLGAAIGFMTWIWISSIVVLVGAELDAEMEHQTARDTTTGPERPLGTRGATKADTVAPA